MLRPEYQELLELKRQTHPSALGAGTRVAAAGAGNHRSLLKGRGLDFSEFREYAPGDDIRAIDWRVTARTGRAHTKIFTEERERSVFVVVDLNRTMEFGTRGTFKSVQAARAAALIAWRAHELHDRFGAVLFGPLPERTRLLPARRSRESIWELLKGVCFPPEAGGGEVPLDEALSLANSSIARGSAVFVISDFFAVPAALERELSRMSRRAAVVLVRVRDPADQVLPHADGIRFSDAAGETVFVDTNDLAGGQLYRSQRAQVDQRLRDLADRYRMRILELSTDRDVASDLFDVRSEASSAGKGRV